ncbi:unnamed protein product [Coregonus sp. 'balchen']|nr:unnamed protein product [Coregonus sp. 'balchen']
MAPTLYDEKPEPGDLIEIFRGTYQHWALYVGDGFVIHLAPPSEAPGARANSMMSVLSDKAQVKKEEIWDVVGHDEWRVNNQLDQKYKVSTSKYSMAAFQMTPHGALVKSSELYRE